MMLRHHFGLETGTAGLRIELRGRLGHVRHEEDRTARTALGGMLGLEPFHCRVDIGGATILGRPDQEGTELVTFVALLLSGGTVGHPGHFSTCQALRGNGVVGFGFATSALGGNVHHEEAGLRPGQSEGRGKGGRSGIQYVLLFRASIRG